MYCSYEGNSNIINSIIWGNSAELGNQLAIGTGFEFDKEPAEVSAAYSDVQGGPAAVFIDTGCILQWDEASNLPRPGTDESNPLFVSGDLGDYYLSQIDANQSGDSSCLDAGTGTADSLPCGRYRYTTRTDNDYDVDEIDMGYHYYKSGAFTKGDIDYNSVIDSNDMAVLVSYWLEECSFPGWCEGSDLNEDGIVNFVDEAILAALYGAGDIEAPLPNRSTWGIGPRWTEDGSVTMTATKAVDNSGSEAVYYFQCVFGNGHDRGWDPNNTYIDTGLAPYDPNDPGTMYWYRVRAADRSGKDYKESYDPNDPDTPDVGNKTEWSFSDYAKTGQEPSDPDAAYPPNWETDPYATSLSSITMVATTSDSGGLAYEEYYFEETSGNPGGNNSGWQTSSTYTDTGLNATTTYSYRVRAVDENGKTTGWSTVLSATTSEEVVLTPPSIDPGDTYQYSKIDPNNGLTYHYHHIAAIDEGSGIVEYRFICQTGDYSVLSSDWQAENTYDVCVGGGPHSLRWAVQGRDENYNETALSEGFLVE